MKTAFSTVACPDWTLERVFAFSNEVEFDGVELRTFGDDSRVFACEPALTASEKVVRLARREGAEIACLATSCRFDEPIRPPVIGRALTDTAASVREAQRAVMLAREVGCRAVRVFGFEVPRRESRDSCVERICERLRAVADRARAHKIRVLVENGGSFSTAADLAELIVRCGSPWVGAAYSVAAGHAAGDDPATVSNTLGDRLWSVKLKDLRGGRPVPLGEGRVPCRETVESLGAAGYRGWLVYEWDRAWLPDLETPESALRRAVEMMQEWLAPLRSTAAAVTGADAA